MPTISQFYGILIQMYYSDHNPPHFHAIYGDHELLLGINPIKILEGSAPGRVKSMVLEWAAIHQTELLEDWELCVKKQKPHNIAPLD
jgi:hypothetical protein